MYVFNAQVTMKRATKEFENEKVIHLFGRLLSVILLLRDSMFEACW
jgi:hypothetical protein